VIPVGLQLSTTIPTNTHKEVSSFSASLAEEKSFEIISYNLYGKSSYTKEMVPTECAS